MRRWKLEEEKGGKGEGNNDEGGGRVIKGRKTEEWKGRDGDEEDGIIGNNDEMRRKKLEGPPLQEKEE